MKTTRKPDDQHQLAHFRDGVDVEMIQVNPREYEALKNSLAGLRKKANGKGKPSRSDGEKAEFLQTCSGIYDHTRKHKTRWAVVHSLVRSMASTLATPQPSV